MSGRIMERNTRRLSGSSLYLIILTAISTFGTVNVYSDQLFNDDIVVKGSICVGVDCNSGENFNFDTIRLKENNLRIRFIDSSSTSTFPTRDWEITVNESGNGGKNQFYIQNIDAGTIPFVISDVGKNNQLYLSTNGFIGMGTSTPLVTQHIKYGNSPTIRLEQDQSSGFTAQNWDIGGNETNFFVRDASNNTLPFRIQPNAPNGSLFIAPDGDIGLGTLSPDGILDLASRSDPNNHSILVSSTGLFGINIDNSFLPRGQFDVQTTGGNSRFMVTTDGKVGIGMGTTGVPAGLFETEISGVSKFLINNSGNVGIGTDSISGRVAVRNNANTATVFGIADDGSLTVGSETPPTLFGVQGSININRSSDHAVMLLNSGSSSHAATIAFGANSVAKWLVSSRHEFSNTNADADDRFAWYNASGSEVLTIHQSGSLFIGDSVGVNNNTLHAIDTRSGAHLTTGGVWTNASSRELKENIKHLSTEAAFRALKSLVPVTYTYKAESNEDYVGFIAEDVPELVATNDRKGLASMDIVAVLTKVLKEQQSIVENQQETINDLNQRIKKLEAKQK